MFYSRKALAALIRNEIVSLLDADEKPIFGNRRVMYAPVTQDDTMGKVLDIVAPPGAVIVIGEEEMIDDDFARNLTAVIVLYTKYQSSTDSEALDVGDLVDHVRAIFEPYISDNGMPRYLELTDGTRIRFLRTENVHFMKMTSSVALFLQITEPAKQEAGQPEIQR